MVVNLYIFNFKSVKKLLYSILFVISILFGIDRIGAEILWSINQHANSQSNIKIRDVVYRTNADVVLMGTSRTGCNYVSSIIADSINLSVYNAGIDASECIFSHYYLLNHLLKRYKPKMICLELWSMDYTNNMNPYNGLRMFGPYFGIERKSDSLFYYSDDWWPYTISHLSRYNSVIASDIYSLFSKKQISADGYLPLPTPEDLLDKPISQIRSNDINSLKLITLQKFIDVCKESNIELLFTISPIYAYIEKGEYYPLYKIAKENSIMLFDYHSKELFLDEPTCFYDVVHLCNEGAEKFTQIFAHDLKEYLNSSHNNDLMN